MMNFMTTKQWRMVVLGTMLWTGTIPAIAATAADAGRLPSDWYTLPEDANATQRDERGLFFNKPASEQSAADAIDSVLEATGASLDQSTNYIGDRNGPVNKPANWVPWHLKEVILDMGVSLQGVMGLITGKGAVSSEVYWRRTAQQQKAMGVAGSRSDSTDRQTPADYVLTDRSTDRDIEQGLEPVIKAVMATGRVQNQGLLRQGLTEAARNLRDLMAGVNGDQRGQWQVNKFRLDVSVQGTGMVQPGLSVGAAIRLKFEWTEAKRDQVADSPTHSRSEGQENLRQLLTGVADDLEQIDRKAYTYSGFDLTTFRVGIGMFFKAKFGIVKGELGVMGYAFFVKSPTRFVTPLRHLSANADLGTVALLDMNPNARHLNYATSRGVRYEALTRDPTRGVVYDVSRQAFRDGLQRAARMGALFAQRARYAPSNNWQIDEVRPQFALSLMGVAGIVTVGGTASLEMQFRRFPQS